jgi:3-dehydroquinate synthetase
LILKHADQAGYTPDIECYLRHGGYEALRKALATMARDKKTVGGRLRFVLPTRIGHVELVDGIDPAAVRSIIGG